MKLKAQFLSLLLISLLLCACHCNTKHRLKGSLIDLDSAVLFRKNFLVYPNEEYHIAQAYMFETVEFEALFDQMSGIDKIRLYPAINTHNDPYDDTLTMVMVPVSASNNADNLSGYIFEYSEMCPNNCTEKGYVPAPTEEQLDLKIPTNWCIERNVIETVIDEGEEVVGTGNVYGIRFYWYNNLNGTMDLELVPTVVNDGMIQNIGNISYKGVTQVCMEGDGCCDPYSPFSYTKRR